MPFLGGDLIHADMLHILLLFAGITTLHSTIHNVRYHSPTHLQTIGHHRDRTCIM